MNDNKNNNQQIDIELTDDVSSGVYSNLAIITHSNSEFVLDFVQMMPGVPKAKVKSRIILTPQHAKRLYKALKDNISKFEQLHGNIAESDSFESPYPISGQGGKA